MATPDEIDPPERLLLKGLRAAGFEVRFERGAWVRCLVAEDRAAWAGRGVDDHAAVLDALRRMVPSPLLRQLLLDAWLGLGRSDLGAAAATPVEEMPGEASGAESEPEPEAQLGASRDREPAPAELAAVEIPRPSEPSVVRAEPPLSRDAALAAFDALLHDARTQGGEVARLARRSMRLVLLGWLAAGRDLAARARGDPAVSERERELFRTVERYSKDYWPGKLPALQAHASPGSCRRVLGCECTPLSWSEVAELAEEAIRHEEQRPGYDEDGWADAAELKPRPRSPDEMLDEVRGRIRNLSREWGPRGIPAISALNAESELGAELVQLASKLRWLRGAVKSPVRWGEAMGRLRRVADRTGHEDSVLATVLEECYRPPSGSWARALGRDPVEKERRSIRRDLLRGRPREGCDPAEVTAWLVRAFDALRTPEIAAVLDVHADVVAAISSDAMHDRRMRRRLTGLQVALATGLRDDACEAAVRNEVARAEESSDAPAHDEALAEASADPEEEMLLRVLPRVRGRRLLFVGNRVDPNLQAVLERNLEPKLLDWLVAEPRRESAAAERIESGSYDLVLCATGFVSHSTELALRSACSAAGIPCVRVYKGRLASCLRALERDLGLSA